MTICEDTTRADLVELLHLLNEDAKAIRRRGYVGIASERYADVHGHIDLALDQLEAFGGVGDEQPPSIAAA